MFSILGVTMKHLPKMSAFPAEDLMDDIDELLDKVRERSEDDDL